MDQLNNYADNRLIDGCIYCGAPATTREHVPSRILLDSPLPDNLPVVGACERCNNGFSKDEEYFACLIESVQAGTTEPDHIGRPRVADILRRKPELRARIESAKTSIDGRIQFNIEFDRVKSVLLKLAQGHVAFELGQVRRGEPSSFWWSPLELMAEDRWSSFNESHVVQMIGEIGSRGMQRALVTRLLLQSSDGSQKELGFLVNDWVDVQEGRYRYLAIDDNCELKVRIVIAEYLGCEVSWVQ